jgi:hypothetical protein
VVRELPGRSYQQGRTETTTPAGLILSRERLGKQYCLILTTTYRQIREREANPNVAAQAKTAVEITQKLRATMAMAWVPIPRMTAERSAARRAIATKTFTETSYNNSTGHSG